MSKSSVRWAFNFGAWKPSQTEILLATSCIQLEEKQRIAKFVFKKDFKASLIGRLMIRKYINNVTDIPYNAIKITRDERGKPLFESRDGNFLFNFNVSHQGSYTVLSGEIGETLVGVDVMQIGYSGGKSLDEFFRIMGRQFSPKEWIQIKSGTTELLKLTTFCRNWSLKESYVKATGVGITVNLQEISFKMNTLNIPKSEVITNTELYLSGKKEPWFFEEMILNENHLVSTALYNPKGFVNHNSVFFKELTFDDLIENAIPLLDEDLDYCLKFLSKDE